MKVTKLTIKNVGLIESLELPLDKPLIVFYGEIKQGKTTVLNAVRWCFGGSFPGDIIRHGAEEAEVTLEFIGGSVSRSWYIAKDGTTKARPVQFIRDGKPVRSPAAEIEKLLNPFLLDQDFLRNKSELERKRFFIELFGVDTTSLDASIETNLAEASNLSATLKGFGPLDLTPVEKPDLASLQAQRKLIVEKHYSDLQAVRQKLKQVRDDNTTALSAYTNSLQVANARASSRLTAENGVAACRSEVAKLERKIAEYSRFLLENPPMDPPPAPVAPDTSELEKQLGTSPPTQDVDLKIGEASAQEVRFNQYQAALKRDAEKKALEEKLSATENLVRRLRATKLEKLAEVTNTCGVPGLAFNQDGSFVFEGTEAGMLSTSQVMKLSSLLSSHYPEGFGLDLIDRAESLGRSVFEFVEKAKREDKTILATVVGEKPAAVPEDVGVFIVEGGKVQ
jgi:hypothetical protein